MGRPLRELSADDRETARALLAEGATAATIAATLGLAERTWRRLRQAGDLEPRPAPENGGRNQVGRFVPGISGNPAGKPRGCRHRTTIAAEALLQGQAEALTQRCVELALKGDPGALRLTIERILPLRRGRPSPFPMSTTEGAGGVVDAVSNVIHAVAQGKLTADEAAAIAGVLETKRKAIETVEIERRLAALEAAGP